MNDFLLQDARHLLAQTNNHPSVRSYYRSLPLSPIWVNNEGMKQMALEMPSFGRCLEHVMRGLFVHGKSPRECELAVRWNLAQPFMNAYGPPHASPFVPEDSVVRVDEQRYWHDDFRHHGTLVRLLKAMAGRQIKRVVELGAGAGNFAAQFHVFWPKAQYIIVDLPDTMVNSMMFLRATFPEAKWLWLTDETKAIDLPSYDFVFVPVGMEHVLHGMDADLFVNTASLGEMPRATVLHWFKFLQEKMNFKFIVSCNRFLNIIDPSREAYRLGENGTAFGFDPLWQVLDWELEPDYLRCPWQNRHARQLLVIAERAGAPDMSKVLTLNDICEGSWLQTPHEQSVQVPVLGGDYRRTGILYALWELNRFSGGDPAVRETFMNYLSHMRGPGAYEHGQPHFEEYLQGV